MTNRLWSKTAMTMLAAVLMLIPTAALADPPEQSGVVARAPVLSAWLFWDGDLIVVNGPPVDADTCLGLATEGFDYEGFLKPISTVVTTPGGLELLTVNHTDRVWVYDDEDTTDPLDWLFGTCAGILGGAAPAPQPLAHGEGRVTTAAGNTRVMARVMTADGRDVHLNVVGSETGTYPDFINYGG